MSGRGIIEFISKKNETFTIDICIPATTIHIENCEGCTFIIEKMAAKLFIGRSNNCKVELSANLMASLCEVFKCSKMELHVAPDITLETLTCESSDVDVHVKNGLSICNVFCTSVTAFNFCMSPPYPEKTTADLSTCNPNSTYHIKWAGGVKDGKVVISLSTRRGGYLDLDKDAKTKDQAQETMIQRMVDMAISTYFPNLSGGSTITSQTTIPSVTNNAISIKSSSNKIISKVPQVEDKEFKPKTERPLIEEAEDFRNSLSSAKDQLKPTTTVIRDKPLVTGSSGPQYNRNTEDEKKEHFDNHEELDSKVKMVAKWIRESKHVIFFTGAGISTSAGISDYRSGMDTVLKTGPGCWELRAQGSRRKATAKHVPLIRALPTITHMALVALHEANICKFTISQNVDGLHLRSGLNPAQIAELHGNTNLEYCGSCNTKYMRDFSTREAHGVYNHETSRLCDNLKCQGVLKDSIINFGENLPEKEIKNGFRHGDLADLCIVLGSSLTVSPACNIPANVTLHEGKLVICNLQKTPLYNSAAINVHAMCDVFMKKLVKEELKIEIPKFKVNRRAQITLQQINLEGSKWNLRFEGLDVFVDTLYSFLQGIYMKTSDSEEILLSKEPYVKEFNIPSNQKCTLELTLIFQGHYGEPDYTFSINITPGCFELKLLYDVSCGSWHHTLEFKS